LTADDAELADKASGRMIEAIGGAKRLVASIGIGGSGPVRMRQRWAAPRTEAGAFIRCLGLLSAPSASSAVKIGDCRSSRLRVFALQHFRFWILDFGFSISTELTTEAPSQ